jgi:hypothetical protein
VIPPSEAFVVSRLNRFLAGRLPRAGETVCVACANANTYLLPWVGSGVTGSRSDYEHWCWCCERFFYGAMQRRYCSEECGEQVRAGRRRERLRFAREQRVSVPRPCVVCGEAFTASRPEARYCSSACRQDAYRKRKAS